MATKYRAAIKTKDGKIIPVFAGRKATYFKSRDKAIAKLCKLNIPARGLIWPAGTAFSETPWDQIYTISL